MKGYLYPSVLFLLIGSTTIEVKCEKYPVKRDVENAKGQMIKLEDKYSTGTKTVGSQKEQGGANGGMTQLNKNPRDMPRYFLQTEEQGKTGTGKKIVVKRQEGNEEAESGNTALEESGEDPSKPVNNTESATVAEEESTEESNTTVDEQTENGNEAEEEGEEDTDGSVNGDGESEYGTDQYSDVSEISCYEDQNNTDTQNKTKTSPQPSEARPLDYKVPFSYQHVKEVLPTFEKCCCCKTVKRVAIGRSGLGNAIFAMEVSGKGPAAGTVVINAGISPGEWQAVNFAIYLIDQLTEQAHKHRHLFFGLSYSIIPILNVDKYRPTGRETDLGPYYASSALEAYMQRIPNIKLYVDLHAGRSAVMYSCRGSCGNVEEMATNMKNVLDHHLPNSRTRVGLVTELDSDVPHLTGWVRQKLKVPYSLYMSLPKVAGSSVEKCLYASFEALKWATLQVQLTDPDLAKVVLKGPPT